MVKDKFLAQIKANDIPETNYSDCHSLAHKYATDTFSPTSK